MKLSLLIGVSLIAIPAVCYMLAYASAPDAACPGRDSGCCPVPSLNARPAPAPLPVVVQAPSPFIPAFSATVSFAIIENTAPVADDPSVSLPEKAPVVTPGDVPAGYNPGGGGGIREGRGLFKRIKERRTERRAERREGRGDGGFFRRLFERIKERRAARREGRRRN